MASAHDEAELAALQAAAVERAAAGQRVLDRLAATAGAGHHGMRSRTTAASGPTGCWRLAGDRPFGLGDLLVDALERATGPVGAVRRAHVLTAEEPLPDDLRAALAVIA
jgi:hypothetical protein